MNPHPKEIILSYEQRILDLARVVADRSANTPSQAFCVDYEPCDYEFLHTLWQALGCQVESVSPQRNCAVVLLNPDQLTLVKSLDCIDRIGKSDALRTKLHAGFHESTSKT